MKNGNRIDLELKLLKEAIWNIEDKINVFMESLADHEAEIIRLNRLSKLCFKRLQLFENLKRDNKKGVND